MAIFNTGKTKLDYSINLNQPTNDPDLSTNADMLSDIQGGLQTDIGNQLQGQQTQQGQQQNVIPPLEPLSGSQRQVMPK